ncbi:MAG: hypothetical protein QOJ00_2643 [Actinomycetota bacterium]|jgi:hypothetical protein
MIRRRIAMLALVLAGFAGMAAIPMATPADAAVTHIVSPVPTGLARLCVIVQASNTGLCIHL